jgi:superfamily I DNA/RNA helicase
VWIFSAFLLGEQAGHVRDGSEMVRFSSKGGYDPQLIECRSLDTQIHKVVEIVRAMLGKGYAARNVLILYRHKNVEGFLLVKRLMMYLDQQHIVYDWIAEDTEAKRSFDWNADTVKISSIQSAKGLDSPVAIILGAETFRPELAGGEYDETKLMYVALTRAREFLAVLYTGNGGLVPKLRHCQEQYLQCRDIIISMEESGVS